MTLLQMVELEDPVLLVLVEGPERQSADGVGSGALDQQFLCPLLNGAQVILRLIQPEYNRGHQVVVVAYGVVSIDSTIIDNAHFDQLNRLKVTESITK